jgi:hypothetical protein
MDQLIQRDSPIMQYGAYLYPIVCISLSISTFLTWKEFGCSFDVSSSAMLSRWVLLSNLINMWTFEAFFLQRRRKQCVYITPR